MKILLTGAKGMLGRTLRRRLEPGHDLVCTDRSQVDLAWPEDVDALVASVRPDVVIHGAAMTDVDRCESDMDAAFIGNEKAAAHVAAAADRYGARLIAFSTGYVFAGDLDRPYHEGDAPGPRSVYGQSKLAGEKAVARFCADHLIVRVGWLYGPGGGHSFVHTMMKLGVAREGAVLKVVNDQAGNPTSTDAVADLMPALLEHRLTGVAHCACEGTTTWFDLTREIFRLKGLKRGVVPCTTKEFPRPAPRPANSCLENRALRLAGLPRMPEWKATLERFLREFPQG